MERYPVSSSTNIIMSQKDLKVVLGEFYFEICYYLFSLSEWLMKT